MNDLIKDRTVYNIRNIIYNCALLGKGEKVLILSDTETRIIGEYFEKQISGKENPVTHITSDSIGMHGQEPAERIAASMMQNDVIFCLTKFSLAHSKARYNATRNNAKFLSLPDYSIELLGRKSLSADFIKLKEISIKLADLLDQGNEVSVTTTLGSEITFSILGRKANACPGWCYENHILASPPDAETNIAAVEYSANGLLVVDGSIPCREIGMLEEPVELIIVDGVVQHVKGGKAAVLEAIFNQVGDPKARVIAEFGMGLNPEAEICGSMLEDEGCLGSVHFGIGSNATIGGNNSVAFHLDHVIRNATVKVDGKAIIENGEIKI